MNASVSCNHTSHVICLSLLLLKGFLTREKESSRDDRAVQQEGRQLPTHANTDGRGPQQSAPCEEARRKASGVAQRHSSHDRRRREAPDSQGSWVEPVQLDGRYAHAAKLVRLGACWQPLQSQRNGRPDGSERRPFLRPSVCQLQPRYCEHAQHHRVNTTVRSKHLSRSPRQLPMVAPSHRSLALLSFLGRRHDECHSPFPSSSTTTTTAATSSSNRKRWEHPHALCLSLRSSFVRLFSGFAGQARHEAYLL